MKRDYKKFPDDDNGNGLWHFRTKGDALTEPREIDFTLIFPSEEAAVEFAGGRTSGWSAIFVPSNEL
jgi:hypothetical protein